MRVVITGGTGFLGQSLLAHYLANSKDEVYTLSRSQSDYNKHFQCDLLDYSKLKNIITQINPDVCHHLAGNPNTRPDYEKPSEIINDNIGGTNNLILSLPVGCRFFLASSVTVFGTFNKFKPADWFTHTNPISVYSTTKLACENLVYLYTKQGRINGTSIRIPALVGKNATHGVLKDIIRKVQLDSPHLNLIGKSPGSIKPFSHVDEVASIFFSLASYSDFGPHIAIVGRRDSISVLDIAKLVMRFYGEKEIVWAENSWPGDNNEIYIQPDISTSISSHEAIVKVIKECRC